MKILNFFRASVGLQERERDTERKREKKETDRHGAAYKLCIREVWKEKVRTEGLSFQFVFNLIVRGFLEKTRAMVLWCHVIGSPN